eukprot:30960-Pelagococcus_subviridis.AAC.2
MSPPPPSPSTRAPHSPSNGDIASKQIAHSVDKLRPPPGIFAIASASSPLRAAASALPATLSGSTGAQSRAPRRARPRRPAPSSSASSERPRTARSRPERYSRSRSHRRHSRRRPARRRRSSRPRCRGSPSPRLPTVTPPRAIDARTPLGCSPRSPRLDRRSRRRSSPASSRSRAPPPRRSPVSSASPTRRASCPRPLVSAPRATAYLPGSTPPRLRRGCLPRAPRACVRDGWGEAIDAGSGAGSVGQSSVSGASCCRSNDGVRRKGRRLAARLVIE